MLRFNFTRLKKKKLLYLGGVTVIIFLLYQAAFVTLLSNQNEAQFKAIKDNLGRKHDGIKNLPHSYHREPSRDAKPRTLVKPANTDTSNFTHKKEKQQEMVYRTAEQRVVEQQDIIIPAAGQQAAEQQDIIIPAAGQRAAEQQAAGQHWFSCSSGQRIAGARLNDDYCDCADGSDEPLTSACEAGRFACPRAARGHRGDLPSGHRAVLPSGWVGDGVCDCCDGADEAPGVCADRCG